MFMRQKKIESVIKELFSAIEEKLYTFDELLCAEVPYKDGYMPNTDANFKKITSNDYVTKKCAHYLIKLNFKTLPNKNNKKIRFYMDLGPKQSWGATSSQGIIYVNGIMRQALDPNHNYIELMGETEYEILVYHYNMQPQSFLFDLRYADSITEKLYYHLLVPCEALALLDCNSTEYSCILRHLDKAVNMLDLRDFDSDAYYTSALNAIKYMENEFYDKACGNTEAVIYAIGQTHIDVAWLWPLKQTVEKVQRSFATVIELMNKYPDYKFMCSQPQLYEYVKEQSPQLYEKIKSRVKEGRWEVEGAMWLEPDCNLVSGESFVRQLIYGKRFLKEEFDVESNFLWLPDVFGYSAALPQILKKCGVNIFATTKISWNEFNKMPYDNFMWKGIDGTEIFTHFFEMLNADLNTQSVFDRNSGFKQKLYTNKAMLGYGFGDGGGGPTPEMLEKQDRLKYGIPGLPKTKSATATEFFSDVIRDFESACKDLNRVPKWVGELYLEFHRGTYTSIAKVKKNNRDTEFMLLNAELLSVMDMALNCGKYPESINKSWKTLLLNQFHDIIPGSSIREVYDDSESQFAEIQQELKNVIESKTAGLINSIDTKGGFLVFNPHSFTASGVAEKDGRIVYVENVPAKGYAVSDYKCKNTICIENKKVETSFYSVEFDESYNIISMYDKQNNREVFSGKANNLTVYEDIPYSYDAWDICEYYKDKSYDVDKVISTEIIDMGAGKALRVVKKFMESTITQDIIFYENIRRVDFKTTVDWKQEHLLLRTHFPVDVNATDAIFDIQFGNIKRATNRNTSWDRAKFEVCGHKWADIYEEGYGFSLMNNCKYGYSVEENVIGLSLIKSAKSPCVDADKEIHQFTYSILPHKGDFREAGTVKEAYLLNMPLTGTDVKENKGKLKDNYSFANIDTESVIIETIKKAEKDDTIVLRVFETYGKRTDAIISFGFEIKEAYLTDMLENKLEKLEIKNNNIKLSFKPYEIHTILLK